MRSRIKQGFQLAVVVACAIVGSQVLDTCSPGRRTAQTITIAPGDSLEVKTESGVVRIQYQDRRP